MYIKKGTLIGITLILVIATAVVSIGIVNPFGFTAFGELLHFSYVTKLVDAAFYKDVEPEQYMNIALEGIAAATEDPYTGYLHGDSAKQYMEDIEGNYQGIGLYIENNLDDDTITVVSAIAGTPAEAAGITTGDKILKINGESYAGSQLNDAASAMRGLEGTEVTVTVFRKNSGITEDLNLVRKKIEIQNVNGTMLTDKIGRINISQFDVGVAEDFKEIYSDLKAEGMEKLILDLRNNPGGLVDEAVEIAGMFVEEGITIVYTMDKYENKEEYKSEGGGEKIPLVVLTNQGSASASEILTAVFKEYGIGYQIGEKTYGKGVVQSVFNVGEEQILSVTIARYYTPNGECIHEKGIEPDKTIKMDVEKYAKLSSLEPENDEHIRAAVEYLSN